ASMQSSITRLCSSWVTVGDSPVVPMGTNASVPSSICHLTKWRKASSLIAPPLRKGVINAVMEPVKSGPFMMTCLACLQVAVPGGDRDQRKARKITSAARANKQCAFPLAGRLAVVSIAAAVVGGNREQEFHAVLRPRITTFVSLLLLVLVSLLGSAQVAEAQSSADLQKLRKALTAVDDRDYEAALSLARELEDPALARLIQWSRLMREGTRVGFRELADFIERHPHWPGQQTLQRYDEEALPPYRRDEDKVCWFRQWPPVSGEGALAFARALRSLGLEGEAQEQALTAWRRMSLSSAVESALLEEFAAVIRPEEILARVERGLQNNDASAPLLAARVSDGHQRLAEARLRLSRMDAGVDAAIERVPASLRDDPGLIYERARWRLRSNMLDGALELLDPPPPVSAETADHW